MSLWALGTGLNQLLFLQRWPVFSELKDLLTLVPPLVGLKGNLEMTLASRLSTAVSGEGPCDHRPDLWVGDDCTHVGGHVLPDRCSQPSACSSAARLDHRPGLSPAPCAWT